MIGPELRLRRRRRRSAALLPVVALVAVACSPLASASPATTIAGATSAPGTSGATLTPAGTPEPGMIVTVVGSGVAGFGGLHGPALDAQLSTPVDVAFDHAGNMYVAERFGDRILVVRPNQTVELAAGLVGEDGSPVGGYTGDGRPATEATLDGVTAVEVDADGNLYIADTLNNRIRRVDLDGTITTLAGSGVQGFGGDGGPAVEANLHWPTGMAFDAAGSLYFQDSGSLRVRRIDSEGTISTVAGTGRAGSAAEGALAREAPLGRFDDHAPNGLAFDADGQLYVADYGNFRVSRIDRDGRIWTVAGTRSFTSAGDGGPAVSAAIAGPLDVCFGSDGSLYIATHTHGTIGNEVRRVDGAGLISTIAGTGPLGFGGDGGPAAAATLSIPSSVALSLDGNLYVADAGNHRIRMIVLPPP